jgi:transcriptional regulator with XRE-family HTH domain
MHERPPVGEVIRAARLELDLSQAEFAARCDISSQYLSLLELGRVNVSLDTLLGISAVINESLSSIFDQAEKLLAGSNIDNVRALRDKEGARLIPVRKRPVAPQPAASSKDAPRPKVGRASASSPKSVKLVGASKRSAVKKTTRKSSSK